MIFARIEESRSFAGCLDPGVDIVGSLQALCEDRSIDTGIITGYGYLEDPEIQLYSRADKDYIAPTIHEGLYAVPTVQGSVSIDKNGKPTVLLFAFGGSSQRGRTKSFAGELRGGQVKQFEFTIQTIDNVVFNRLKDSTTGLQLWLQMLPAGFVGTAPSASPTVPVDVLEEPEEDFVDGSDDELVLDEGDWLNHPRLGMCYVIHFDGDRIKVRLQSGRIAELMMTMFRLRLDGVKDGGSIFKVTVKKRKP
jgi:predicted DNA-binding protein with PD1-like motif